jgi:hypothetical protein
LFCLARSSLLLFIFHINTYQTITSGISAYQQMTNPSNTTDLCQQLDDNQETRQNSWDFVDNVYLITYPNSDPNSERLNKAKGILDKVGLLDCVEVKAFDPMMMIESGVVIHPTSQF